MAVWLSMAIVQNSQNIANNTSNVTVTVIAEWDFGSFNVNQKSGTCTIDGTEYSFTSSFNTGKTQNGSQVLYAKTLDVTHNSVGERTVEASASYVTGVSSGTIYASGKKNLTPIPRATVPTLSASSVEMGKSVNIYCQGASSNFRHKLWYTIGNSGWVVIAENVATSYSWTIPLSLATYIPSSTSGTITIAVETFNGSTLIGEKRVTLTATVPSSVVPSISSVVTSDPTGNLGTYGAYVQGNSTCQVTATAAGSYGSTILSYNIVVNRVTYTSNGATTGTLYSSGNIPISVTVTDSRGRTATSYTSISVIAYSSPTISSFSVIRCNSDGTANEDGAYMKAVYKASITSLNGKNSKSIVLKYKESTASSWTTAETHSAYSVDTSKVISADIDKSYDLMLTATDDFSSASNTKNLPTAFTLIDFRSTGRGMAIGKVSEKDAFECDLDAEFKTITSDSIVTRSGANLDRTTPRWNDISNLVNESNWSVDLTSIWNNFYEAYVILTLKSNVKLPFTITYRERAAVPIVNGYMYDNSYHASVGIVFQPDNKIYLSTSWTRLVDNGTTYSGVNAVKDMKVYWR